MKPIGPLMWEHRLIEQMVRILKGELQIITGTKNVDSNLISGGIDFFKTYADRTHHGKEEDILFKKLHNKELSFEHEKIMSTLIEDHIFARKTVGALRDANELFIKGKGEPLNDIVSNLGILVELYPRHISRGDKEFFYPCMEYFDEEEQKDMLQEFGEFDRKMIHEKYMKLVNDLEH